MSGVDALARALALYAQRNPGRKAYRYATQAERLLANPGPLLEALAEAGVLHEVYALARHDPQPSMSGPKVQRAGESPDRSVMERVSGLPLSEGRWIERPYVTEWRPDARP